MAQRIDGIDPITPTAWEIARGRVTDTTALNRFGFIGSIGSAYETVWEAGGLYEYPAQGLAMTATSLAGTPANDSGVEITITGLNSSYETITETLVLDAAGTATGTELFYRINEARVTNGQAPTGDIEITNGSTTYSYIDSEFGKSLSSVYTVPTGKRAYILSGSISLGKQKEVIAKLMIRPQGGIFTAEGIIGSSGVPYTKDWVVPIELEQHTDIEIRAKAGATTEIATAFEIILVDR